MLITAISIHHIYLPVSISQAGEGDLGAVRYGILVALGTSLRVINRTESTALVGVRQYLIALLKCSFVSIESGLIGEAVRLIIETRRGFCWTLTFDRARHRHGQREPCR